MMGVLPVKFRKVANMPVVGEGPHLLRDGKLSSPVRVKWLMVS